MKDVSPPGHPQEDKLVFFLEVGEEVVFHVAADERVAECPVQHGQPGQVKHPQAHHVDPSGLLVRGEHGQPDVL